MLNPQIVFIFTFFSLLFLETQAGTPTQSSTPDSDPALYDGRPSWSPDGNHIGFLSYRSGNLDVWVMDADGSNPVDVTSDDPATNLFFVWSPNSEFIAYTSQVAGDSHSDIWTVSKDGSNPINITGKKNSSDRFYNTDPQWSPNGQFISFSSQNAQDADIVVVDVNSFIVTNVTDNIDGIHTLSSWSPNSEKLVFTTISNGLDDVELWVKSLDKTDASPITSKLNTILPENAKVFSISSVAWSPQNDLIAFTVQYDVNSEIILINQEGNIIQNLSKGSSRIESAPVWSSDGQRLAFQSLDPKAFSDGNSDIWVINYDGTEAVNITAGSNSKNSFPTWSPTGTQIAIESNRNGNDDVWVIDSDGSNILNLTTKDYRLRIFRK